MYNNIATPNTGFKGDYGNATAIEADNQIILYDTGNNGDILVHNLKTANIDLNSIRTLILSHGHNDHSRGLAKLLELRTTKEVLPVIAHPLVKEKKKASLFAYLLFYLLYREIDIGFPELSNELEKKVKFDFHTNPYQITSYLSTVGEITKREEPDGSSILMVHQENGGWKKDLIYDDLSLVLKTKKGLVLLCGCCHSGILNTCSKLKQDYPKEKIHAIIGGTHMLTFSKKKIKHVAEALEKQYDSPHLYLNHCTGKKALSYLKEYFSNDIFHDFLVGEVLNFEC